MFAAAACSVPVPSIDPLGIDAGSGDNAVSREFSAFSGIVTYLCGGNDSYNGAGDKVSDVAQPNVTTPRSLGGQHRLGKFLQLLGQLQ